MSHYKHCDYAVNHLYLPDAPQILIVRWCIEYSGVTILGRTLRVTCLTSGSDEKFMCFVCPKQQRETKNKERALELKACCLYPNYIKLLSYSLRVLHKKSYPIIPDKCCISCFLTFYPLQNHLIAHQDLQACMRHGKGAHHVLKHARVCGDRNVWWSKR